MFDVSSMCCHRVRTELGGGAWCPKLDNSQPGAYEYLQIDLGELKVIVMTETQGRSGSGQVSMRMNANFQSENLLN